MQRVLFDMELWFTERQTENVGITLKTRGTLVRETTPYQELAIVETEQYGRMLVLDGMVQTTEGDEFTYHEMIAHVAMFTHPRPQRVLVIGGGDGGAIREVLKHPAVERATLVEIDRRVVEQARRYLPAISGALDDPRVELRFEDGIRHVAETRAHYDVILVDSTEPVGAAIGLFSPGFYAQVREALRPDGVLVAQTESPFFNRDLLRSSYLAVRSVFPLARLYLASVPTYPSGLWSFTLGSKGPDPLAVPAARWQPLPTRYYSPAVHRAAFVLPRFVEELLNDEELPNDG